MLYSMVQLLSIYAARELCSYRYYLPETYKIKDNRDDARGSSIQGKDSDVSTSREQCNQFHNSC